MADILVRFEVNPDGATEKVGDIKSDNIDLINNVGINVDSTGTYIIKPDGTFKGTEMLSLATGKLKFNESGYLANSKTSPSGKLQSSKNPRAYVWGATNSNGQLTKKYEDGTEEVVNLTITIQKTSDSVNIDKIVLIGDKVSQQFPTEIYLDGDSSSLLYSDDANFAIEFSSASDTHTITITKWNRPNYNATLTQIRAMLQYLEYDKASIDSLSSLTETSTDFDSINYSVLANSGKGRILDKDTEIRDLVESGMIKDSGLKYQILLNGNPIRSHIIDSSTYLYNEWDFSATDELGNLDNGVFTPVYSDYKLKDILLRDLLTHILNNSTPKFTFSFNDKIAEYAFADIILKNIDISELSQYNLRQILNYICEVSQTSITCFNKELKISNARPVELLDNKNDAINIPINYVFDDSGFSYIVNNKYDKINYSVFNDEKRIKVLQHLDTSYFESADYENAIQYIQERSVYDSGDLTANDLTDFFDYLTAGYITNTDYNIYVGVKNIELSEYTNFNCYIDETNLSNSNFLRTVYYTQPSNTHKDIKLLGLNLLEYGRDINQAIDLFISRLTDASDNIFEKTDELIACGLVEDELTSPNYNFVKKYKLVVMIKQTDNTLNYPFRFLITTQSDKVSGQNVSTKPSYIESISKNSADVTVSATNDSNKELSFSSNPLLTYSSTSENRNLFLTLSQNIIYDYYLKNTVYSKTVKVYLDNLKNILGSISKDINNGEILENGDIIYFYSDKRNDGSLIYWKILSVDFVYDGEPYLILNVQSIYYLELSIYGLFQNNKLVKTWNRLISDGDIIIYDSTKIHDSNKELSGELLISNTITTISENAFKNCSALTKVIIPDTVKSIGERAFYYCRNLDNLNIPLQINYLGPECFSWCSSLKQIKIPTSIDTLYYGTFSACKSLKTIFIPKNIENIILVDSLGQNQNGPFWACDSSLVIYCEAESKPSNWDTYWNVYGFENYQYKYLTVKWGYTYEQYVLETGNI